MLMVLTAFATSGNAFFNAFMTAFFALALITANFVVMVTVLVTIARFHDHIFSTPDNQHSEQQGQ